MPRFNGEVLPPDHEGASRTRNIAGYINYPLWWKVYQVRYHLRMTVVAVLEAALKLWLKKVLTGAVAEELNEKGIDIGKAKT